MKLAHKLLAHVKGLNQLKMVTKIAISKLTETTGDRNKTSTLYATCVKLERL